MKLFAPDNHTPNHPTYEMAPAAAGARVNTLLQSAYQTVFAGTALVETIGGVNLNSANYRVGPYYVKLLKARPELDFVSRFPLLNDALRAAGLAVPQFVPNDRTELVSAETDASGHLEWYFYVQHFLDANFFTGSLGELRAALDAIERLGPAVEGIAPTPGQKEPYRGWKPLDLLEMISLALDARAAAQRTDAFDEMTGAQLEQLRRVALAFEAERGRLHFSRLHHFDLHPHNLFFKGSELRAVLDLESFRAMPAELAAAFDLFKLGRKAIATRQVSVSEFKILVGGRFDPKRLRELAHYELLRRITVVLKLHYLDSNYDWDQDLVKHLAGFGEATQLFT